jgi:hypothetical protein
MRSTLSVLLVVLVAALPLMAGADDGANSKPQAPKTGFAWFDEDGHFYITCKPQAEVSGKPPSIMREDLVFDPADKSTGPRGGGGGLLIREAGVPWDTVAVLTSLSDGVMWARYANIQLDVSALKGKPQDVCLFDEMTPSGDVCCHMALVFGQHRYITISGKYLLFADQDDAVAKGGPFVSVRFAGTVPAGAVLSLRRKGKSLPDAKVGGQDIALGWVSGTNDVLEWTLSDAQGAKLASGQIGFPITSATPGLVVYTIGL